MFVCFFQIKDIWEMDTDEKLQQCYMFKDKGNMYYNVS